MSVTLSEQDKLTLWTGAHGAVSLMTAAGTAGSPHKIATDGSLSLASATGLVGHVLTKKPKGWKLNGRSTAGLADEVLPALTATMSLLKRQDPAEADNFRGTIIVAIEAASSRAASNPTMADMARKITEALDAA